MAPLRPLHMNLVDSLEKLMVGMIFPEDEIQKVDPNKELASFDDLATGSPEDISVAHNSMARYLLEWGKALERADGSDKLTTPIFCSRFEAPTSPPQTGNTNRESMNHAVLLTPSAPREEEHIVKTSGMKISFRKTKRYLSANEQRGLEKGRMPDRKGAKIDSGSPGGLALLVRTIGPAPVDDPAQKAARQRLCLSVTRCDVDGDTVVKAASERTIVRRLKFAVRIWTNMRSM